MYMIPIPKSLINEFDKLSVNSPLYVIYRPGSCFSATKNDLTSAPKCAHQNGDTLVGQCQNAVCNFINLAKAGVGWQVYLWKDGTFESVSSIKDLLPTKKAATFCESFGNKVRCPHCRYYYPVEQTVRQTCFSCLIISALRCDFCNVIDISSGHSSYVYSDLPANPISRIGLRIPVGDKLKNDAYSVCADCKSKNIKSCVRCDVMMHMPELYQIVEGDVVCNKCNTVINEYNYKPHPVFLSTKEEVSSGQPLKRFFGLELEVEMRRPFGKFMEIVATGFSKDTKNVAYLKKDASIAQGFEIVTHPGTFDWWNDKNNPLIIPLKKLVPTCESWGTETCGIHVHVSSTGFKNATHKMAFAHFMTAFPLFSSFIAERYNAKQSPFNSMYVNPAPTVADTAGLVDRHTAINFATQASATVEVRIFKGNLKWQRILKNIQFIDAVISYSEVTPQEKMSVKSFKEFVDSKAARYQDLQLFIKSYKKDL